MNISMNSRRIVAAAALAFAAAMPGRLMPNRPQRRRSRSAIATLAASSPVQTDRKRASGLLPRRPIFRPNSPRSLLPTTLGVT